MQRYKKKYLKTIELTKTKKLEKKNVKSINLKKYKKKFKKKKLSATNPNLFC